MDVYLLRSTRYGDAYRHLGRPWHFRKTALISSHLRTSLCWWRTSFLTCVSIPLCRSSRLICILLSFLHPFSIQRHDWGDRWERRLRCNGFIYNTINDGSLANSRTECLLDHTSVFSRGQFDEWPNGQGSDDQERQFWCWVWKYLHSERDAERKELYKELDYAWFLAGGWGFGANVREEWKFVGNCEWGSASEFFDVVVNHEPNRTWNNLPCFVSANQQIDLKLFNLLSSEKWQFRCLVLADSQLG